MKDDLIKKTVEAHIKHLGLKIKDGIIYNENLAIFTLSLNWEQKDLYHFLEGYSHIHDKR